MKIAFDMTTISQREYPEDTKTIIHFMKILKRAGHFIILWDSSQQDDINAFIYKYKISGYADLVVSKLSIKPQDLPDIAFDMNEKEISHIITIKI